MFLLSESEILKEANNDSKTYNKIYKFFKNYEKENNIKVYTTSMMKKDGFNENTFVEMIAKLYAEKIDLPQSLKQNMNPLNFLSKTRINNKNIQFITQRVKDYWYVLVLEDGNPKYIGIVEELKDERIIAELISFSNLQEFIRNN